MIRSSNSQRGVMLIEALIGILIFSIGILALIGMQAAAIKNTNDARYRSEASYLANQIIGQIWVDRGNLASYDDAVTSYTPSNQWRADVAALLPGVAATTPVAPATRNPSIRVDTADNNQVSVVIQWRQPGETTDRRLQMINWIN